MAKGADVNAESGEYGTALRVASLNGHEKIVEMLLVKGANIYTESGPYGTALKVALSRGHGKIVAMLLERVTNIKVRGNGTALQVASSEEYKKVVEVLLLQQKPELLIQSKRFEAISKTLVRFRFNGPWVYLRHT